MMPDPAARTVTVARVPGSDPDVPLPAAASAGAAGLDLRANLPPDRRARGVTIDPGGRALVPSGLAVAIPPGWEFQVRPRSGLALRHGIALVNAPGTIDSDYRGEIGVILLNTGDAPFRVDHGARIAQLVLAPVTPVRWAEAEALPDSPRGADGFGSSGV